jgi:retron-type reverse transcriptase
MLPRQVASLALTAPLRYKDFPIKKRNGGERIVSQPAREVKFIQELLREILEPGIPFHDCIAAYRVGDSIKKNALRHLNSQFILKMDLVNFFPSITERDIKLHFEKYYSPKLSDDELQTVANICCKAEKRSRPLRLCIGAPSSPWLSNSVLFDIDSALHQMTAPLGVTYSRYADDLTFSCSERDVLGNLPSEIEKIVRGADYPKLSINHDKTIHASRASNRTVTGIVITPDGGISVGRERKRRVMAMHHRLTRGMLNDDQKEELEGLINFIEHIEPGFRRRLLKKNRTSQ